MFYLFRIIFIVVLFLVVEFAFFKYIKRQVANGKKYTKQKILLIALCLHLPIVLLSFASFIPFEGAFLRFDSVEDSLNYKWIDMQYVTVHYEDNFAIAVKGDDEIYTFDKNDEGFGLVNYHLVTHKYLEPDDSLENQSISHLYSVYHKTADKTFYLLNYATKEYQEDVIDSDNINLKYFAHPLFTKSEFGYVHIIGSVYQVFDVTDDKPLQEIHVRYKEQYKTFTY